MKRAFGFDAVDDNDIEIEGIDATVRPLNLRKNSQTADIRRSEPPRDTEELSTPLNGPALEEELRPDPSLIFEKVVAVFNESLPGFLQKSVDPARQRQALFDAMDASIKDYYEHLERNTERRLQSRFENDRRRLQAQIDDLRVKAQKEEEGNSNAKNLQLSAERQKRALSERVHDLEKQLATLEAENEQYILENKSMANKLRMAAMAGDVPDENLAAEMQKRDEQIAELQKLASETENRLASEMKVKAETETALADARQQVELLENQLASKSASETDDMELLLLLQKENGELKQTAEGLQEEIEKLRSSLEQAKVKDELGVAMVNDLNSKAHEAKQEAAEARNEALEAQIVAEQAASELEKAKDATLQAQANVKELEEKLTAANDQLAAVNAKFAKAQADLQVVKEIQNEVLKLEETQRETDAQIRAQKDELMEKDEQLKQLQSDLAAKNTSMRMQEETIRRLEDQTDSLRKNVENVLYEKSQVESALRSEIDRLKTIKGTVADLEMDPSLTVVTVVETDPNGGDDLALDLPEFVSPTSETADGSKPRRGRPAKNKGEDASPAATGLSSPKKQEEKDLDLIDSTDWLIATPPEESKPKRQRKQKNNSDDSFGYKEPERQEPPDNPAQMLLW